MADRPRHRARLRSRRGDRALAARASLVVGVDHSQVVLGQARRRNRAAVRAGRVRLVHASVEGPSISDGTFDAALAVNTVGRWPDPTTRLREIARLLRPGGRIAAVSQPRCPGATAATSAAAATELIATLTEAGFERCRTKMLDLDPPVACVLGYVPTVS
jgi:ubiquinone/menaquinone biosynthesis C-methylase UbiE